MTLTENTLPRNELILRKSGVNNEIQAAVGRYSRVLEGFQECCSCKPTSERAVFNSNWPTWWNNLERDYGCL